MRQTFALIGVLLFALPARAGKVEATTWEAFALDVEAIVEAECVTAGLRVARYRVVESWKGLEAGVEFVVSTPGVHLVGQRRLLALEPYVDPAPRGVPDFLSGDSATGLHLPTTYRSIPATWSTPFFRGSALLPLTGKRPLRHFASDTHTTLTGFREDVVGLLEAPAEEQELRVLKGFARLYLGRSFRGDPGLLERVEQAKEVGQTLDMLMEARRYEVVGKGREGALALLEARDDFQLQVHQMRQRLGLEPRPVVRRSAPEEPEEAPDDEQLTVWLEAWITNEPGSHGALRQLVRYAPGALVNRLAQQTFGRYDEPYWLGSYVCAATPPERSVDLLGLLDAKDPWLQVAGAVYACFDDLEAGLAALRERTDLADGPGAWAALTLARRGDAAALERALQVLETKPDHDTRRAGLTWRVVIVLSNAAAAAEVPLPPTWDAAQAKADPVAHGARYLAWYEEHREALKTVGDPWLEQFTAQRVD